MINAARTKLQCQFQRTDRIELIGMNTHRHTQLPRLGKQRAAHGYIPRAFFTICIHSGVWHALCHALQQCTHVGHLRGVLAVKRVTQEKRWNDWRWPHGAHGKNRFKHLEFSFGVEAVSGFYFNGARTHRAHLCQALR